MAWSLASRVFEVSFSPQSLFRRFSCGIHVRGTAVCDLVKPPHWPTPPGHAHIVPVPMGASTVGIICRRFRLGSFEAQELLVPDRALQGLRVRKWPLDAEH
eukprot:2605928-Pyramimonas_sp.AAC.1